MRFASSIGVRFGGCASGSIAPLFALLMAVLMMFLGLAIDMSRLYYVRSKVQGGLDAASLAAAKAMDQEGATAADVQAVGEAYFSANLGGDVLQQALLTNFRATADFTTHTVQASVDIALPTLFLPAAGGATSLAMTPGANAIYATTRLEVALVLDVTGSMNDPSADGTIKIEALKAAAKNFVDILYSGNPQRDFVRIGLAPFSGAVNAGARANALAGIGSDTCVVDRDGAQAYTDTVPTTLSRLGRSSNAVQPGYFCPTVEIKPLQDLSSASARSSFASIIDGLAGNGGTAGHVGVAWGWYLVSPTWSSVWGTAAGRPYAANVKKIVIVLTDGQFNTAYGNGGAALSPADAVNPAVAGSAPYQALQLCNTIKTATSADNAITIYTIGFTTPPEAEALLAQCSGAANFYSADDTSQLNASFRAIATKLTNLRVSS